MCVYWHRLRNELNQFNKIHISYLAFLVVLLKISNENICAAEISTSNKKEDIIHSVWYNKWRVKNYWYIIEPALYIHISFYVTSWDVEFPQTLFTTFKRRPLLFKKGPFWSTFVSDSRSKEKCSNVSLDKCTYTLRIDV